MISVSSCVSILILQHPLLLFLIKNRLQKNISAINSRGED